MVGKMPRRLARLSSLPFAWSLLSPSALPQIADQLIFYAVDADLTPPQNAIFRFNRKLDILGYTSITALGGYLSVRDGMGVDSSGVYSFGLDHANLMKLLRIDSGGTITLLQDLTANTLSTRVGKDGTSYTLTWGGAFQVGPAYAVAADGTITWSKLEGPMIYAVPSEFLAITPMGRLWIGGSAAGFSGGFFWTPVIQMLDLKTGAVIKQTELPTLGLPGGDTFLSQLEAAPDGTLWAMLSGYFPLSVTQTDGINALKTFPVDGGWNGNTNQIRVDANGDLLTVSFYTEESEYGGQIRKFSQVDGSLLKVYSISMFPGVPISSVGSFALGPTGEDVYAAIGMLGGPAVARINLVTGARSLRLFPSFSSPTVPPGDPTGFIHANVIDQTGDNDGDGYTNRVETLAGSHPFRAESRPNGPKVYLSFLAGSNSIVLTFKDNDGLLNQAGGLDLASLSLVADAYGNILPLLWSFTSKIELTPDGKQATVEFGNLPIPSDLEIGLEATVRDKTGAEGWDWQVTPPGILSS
jgi:hypothetical protein